MTLVDRHIGQRLVTFPFSPAPPKPKVVIQEVVRQPEALPEAIKEQVSRQDQEITKLEREIELLTLLLKRQTEETKVPALYLGRKVSDR
jgi:hypothetical protein